MRVFGFEPLVKSHERRSEMKNLFELHQGEIREVGYKWERVHSPMPWRWNSPWYNKQYQQSPYQSRVLRVADFADGE